MTPALEIHSLKFAWPKSAFTLHLARWEVPAGAHAAICGPSGSGKSTLLRLLGGELAPESGTIRVGGTALNELDARRRRMWRRANVGMVFQEFPLVPWLNVEENVLLPCRLAQQPNRTSETRAHARQLLDALGLKTRGRDAPDELSVGERQRVAVARALVTRPTLVLADEPTSGLDPKRSTEVVNLLEDCCREAGASMVLVTHDSTLRGRFSPVLDLDPTEIS